MQTEREFLKEVDNLLGAIRRAPDERRKEGMRTHLHQNIYPKKFLYGFASIAAVRQSVDYMRAGKPDPSKDQRYRSLLRTIDRLTGVKAEWDKQRQAEKEAQDKKAPEAVKQPQSMLFFLKLTRLDGDKSPAVDKGKAPDGRNKGNDLERD